VTNTPDVLSDATAEVTIMLMLGAARRAGEGERLVRTRTWRDWSPSFMVGTQVTGKRLGIVGLGVSAGSRRGEPGGFDMNHPLSRPAAASTEQEEGAIFTPHRKTSCRTVTFLRSTAWQSPQTRRMLNAERIALLPDGAIVVNASRGAVVDEDALIAALKSGKVAAAGLDVYNNEPDIDPRYGIWRTPS